MYKIICQQRQREKTTKHFQIRPPPLPTPTLSPTLLPPLLPPGLEPYHLRAARGRHFHPRDERGRAEARRFLQGPRKVPREGLRVLPEPGSGRGRRGKPCSGRGGRAAGRQGQGQGEAAAFGEGVVWCDVVCVCKVLSFCFVLLERGEAQQVLIDVLVWAWAWAWARARNTGGPRVGT